MDHWKYNALDCVAAWWSIDELMLELEEEKMMGVYNRLYVNLFKPLLDMNIRGVRVNIDKLKKPHSFFSWLLGIADHVAREFWRKEQIQLRRQDIHSFSEETSSAELSQNFALEKAITELPKAYRNIILLRYYDEQSCSRIAEQLDMPIGTVTKQLSRAYAMLRDSLQQQAEA